MHVFYSNSESLPSYFPCLGAAAYFEMKEYQKALEDATEASTRNGDFAKAHLRKALAERELLLNEASLDSSGRALELDPENKVIKDFYEECKSEWDDDHTVDEEHPEKKRFQKLENWLQDGGAIYDKLKIRFYNPIYRGVHAARKIKVSGYF